jgi:hypothetical protein
MIWHMVTTGVQSFVLGDLPSLRCPVSWHGRVAYADAAVHHAQSPQPIDWVALTAIGTFVLAAITLVTLLATVVMAWRSGRQVRSAEQLTEANAIQVIFGGMVTIVINRSRYTIVNIEARVSLDNGVLSEVTGQRLLNLDGIGASLTAGATPKPETVSRPHVLTPWDTGLRLVCESSTSFMGAYPIVRWTDRWGTRWEHRRGDARPIKSRMPWPAT